MLATDLCGVRLKTYVKGQRIRMGGMQSVIANFDKRQYLNPRKLADASDTVRDVVRGRHGTLAALGVLLAAETQADIMNLAGAAKLKRGQAGLAPRVSDRVVQRIGSWAGNRIAVVTNSDATAASFLLPEDYQAIHAIAGSSPGKTFDFVMDHFLDISNDMLKLFMETGDMKYTPYERNYRLMTAEICYDSDFLPPVLSKSSLLVLLTEAARRGKEYFHGYKEWLFKQYQLLDGPSLDANLAELLTVAKHDGKTGFVIPMPR